MTQRRKRKVLTTARAGAKAPVTASRRLPGSMLPTGKALDEFTEFVASPGDPFDAFSEGFAQAERGGQATPLQKRMNSGDF